VRLLSYDMIASASKPAVIRLHFYNYEEATFGAVACLRAMRFCRILDKALLALIGLLAAEEAGKTWLSRTISLGDTIKSDKKIPIPPRQQFINFLELLRVF
jgi:hypothetical protein